MRKKTIDKCICKKKNLFAHSGPNTEPVVCCSSLLTQAVETESTIVKEEADVTRPHRHAAEGVSTAGCQRVDAAGEQENHHRPGEGVLPCCLHQHHGHQFPQEVPVNRNRTLS